MIGIGHKIDMILEIWHVFLFFWYYPYVESDNYLPAYADVFWVSTLFKTEF